jgi:hypothetical protein
MSALRGRGGLLALLALVVAMTAALGAYQGHRYRTYLAEAWGIPPAAVNLYKADYWMGELVESIVERGEYRGCYPSPVSAQPATVGLCFSAHRMPVVPWFMAITAKIWNDITFFVVLKNVVLTVLLVIPLWMMLAPLRSWWPLAAAMIAVFLLDPANLQMFMGTVSEESFFVPQMALAGALLFIRDMRRPLSTARLIGLALLVMAMPMTKSSALLPAAVIAVAPLIFVRPNRLTPLLPLAGLVVSLALWGAFTYKATGHFAFGSSLSSLNGYNLHHGYTPYYGEVAPRYHLDVPVWRGQIKLEAPVKDEWEFNKHFADRAIAFAKEDPLRTAWYFAIKIYTAVFKITPEYRLQSGEDGFFHPKHLILTAGLLIDRFIMWLSLGIAAVVCWRIVRQPAGWKTLLQNPDGWAAVVLILVSLSYLLPFVIAFANYRHIVPLYYFEAIYLAMFILRSPKVEGSRLGMQLRRWLGGAPAAAPTPA